MAKSYADSVKLPNLVSVQHPLTKYSPKCNLNIEGRNSLIDNSFTSFTTKAFDRKAYIASLLDNDETKSKGLGEKIQTNSDQVLDLINEKLNTGYHGVKHLFKSNDINKNGRLSKESFKWVLNQLCGYISNDAWHKIMLKFKLDELETISFDEFISYFDTNQKVKKDMVTSNRKSLTLIDFKSSSMINLLSQRDLSKKVPMPEISASYCLSLIRSKAVQKDFDPKNYLPEECFTKNMVLPHHLKTLLGSWDLKISVQEFQKLWSKFDIGNTGCCRLKLFLRLINNKTNKSDDTKIELIKNKACILDKLDFNSAGNKLKRQNTFLNSSRSNFGSVIFEHEPKKEEKNEIVETVREVKEEHKIEDKKEDDKKENEIEELPNLGQTEAENSRSSFNRKIESGLSEARIKSMVHTLKRTNEFGPNNDLVIYLNNKLNEGLIVLRTAFEYIDQDHLGHLLSFEFRSVLDEFKIYTDSRMLDKLLKKNGLLKSDKIVDYMKFLQVFQDRGPYGLYKSFVQHGKNDGLLEDQIIEFFHQNYITLHNYFKDSIDESTCSTDHMKRLIENKFSIIIEDSQFENLLNFLNIDHPSSKANWEILFKKFSEIDPWKIFKESYEKSSTKIRKLSASSIRSNHSRSKSLLNLKKSEQIIELVEKPIQEQDNESDFYEKSDINFGMSSDDELYGSIINNLNRRQDHYKNAKDYSKNFKNELKRTKNLEKKVEAIIRLQFHSITKYFSVLDPTRSERIDKEGFHQLMIKCGAKFTQEEIDLLWKDFEADSIPFSNFLRRFFIHEEFSNLREIRHKIKLEKQLKDESKNGDLTARSSLTSFSLVEFKPKKEQTKRKINKKIFEIARPVIVENWTQLKNDFKKEDKLAKTSIAYARAFEILRNYQVPLNESELNDLCDKFHSNGTNFNYIKFLKYFKNDKSNDVATVNPLLMDLIARLREKHFDSNKSKQPNGHDISNLRLIFKKYDSSKKGFLTQAEFKNLLSYCDLNPSSDHMYMILCEYDPDLKGTFYYENFIQSLIEKMLV